MFRTEDVTFFAVSTHRQASAALMSCQWPTQTSGLRVLPSPKEQGLSLKGCQFSDFSDCCSNPYLAALPSFQGSNLGLIVLGFSRETEPIE